MYIHAIVIRFVHRVGVVLNCIYKGYTQGGVGSQNKLLETHSYKVISFAAIISELELPTFM